MKKLKTILQSNIILIILTVITIVYLSFYYNTKKNIEEKNKIDGIIEKIDITDNYINLYIKSNKEKYLLKTKENKEYKLGYKIESYGKSEIPQKNTIPNLFNYQNYLKSKKIYQIFYAEKLNIKSKKINYFYKIKNKIYEKIDSYKNTNKYLRTFILGDNSLIEDNVQESFSNNGIIRNAYKYIFFYFIFFIKQNI